MSLDQAQVQLTEIVCPHTVVHPWAMMIHPADASVADAAVMRHGWLECLTLSTHAVRILHQPLTFRRYGGQRYTARISQTCLSM